MFKHQHFYHRIIRRAVVAFGNMFNQIELVRYEKGTFNEIDRITVPIAYAQSENYAKRLNEHDELPAAVQVKLPRMAFQMTGLRYAPERKLSSMNEECVIVNGKKKTVPTPVPYDLSFRLNIYVRNTEDGTQIVEQILPNFTPSYTFAMTYIDEMNLVRNVPLTLDSVDEYVDYEGPAGQARSIMWELTFTMGVYFYGKVNDDAGKLIREVHANTFIWDGKSTNLEHHTSLLAQEMTVTPDPFDAGPDDDYGFIIDVVEHNDG